MPYSAYKEVDGKKYETRTWYPTTGIAVGHGVQFALRRAPTTWAKPAVFDKTKPSKDRWGDPSYPVLEPAVPCSNDGFFFSFFIMPMPHCCGASFMHGFSVVDTYSHIIGDGPSASVNVVTDTDVEVFRQWFIERLSPYAHPVFFIIHEEEWGQKTGYGANYIKMCGMLREFSEEACQWTNSIHTSRLEMRATIPAKLKASAYDVKFETPTRG